MDNVLVTPLCLTLCDPHGLQPSRLLCPWDSPGKNTGVGVHFLLQRIFPTQGLNLHLLCLLHCRQILYPLSRKVILCGHRYIFIIQLLF